MISILLFIGGIVALIAGICLFVFNYAPFISNFFNSITSNYSFFFDLLPSWLLPWALVPLALAGIGLLIKLL